MADLDLCRHGMPRGSCVVCTFDAHLDSAMRDILKYQWAIRDLASTVNDPVREFRAREQEVQDAVQAAGRQMEAAVEQFHVALSSHLETMQLQIPDLEERSIRDLQWEPPALEPAGDVELDQRLSRLEQKVDIVLFHLLKAELDEEN